MFLRGSKEYKLMERVCSFYGLGNLLYVNFRKFIYRFNIIVFKL